jgi:predicted RNA-binding protein
MCLSKAYIDNNGKREFLMTDIATVKGVDGKLILKNLFGETKELSATIREIDFTASILGLELSGEGVSVT